MDEIAEVDVLAVWFGGGAEDVIFVEFSGAGMDNIDEGGEGGGGKTIVFEPFEEDLAEVGSELVVMGKPTLVKVGATFGIVDVFIECGDDFAGDVRRSENTSIVERLGEIFEAGWGFAGVVTDGIGHGKVDFGASDGNEEFAEQFRFGGAILADGEEIFGESEKVTVAFGVAPVKVIYGDKVHMFKFKAFRMMDGHDLDGVFTILIWGGRSNGGVS